MSANEYLKSPPNYKPKDPGLPPHVHAEQVADFVAAVDKREKLNYKIALVLTLSVLGISVCGNIMQAMSSRVETIFVPVDATSAALPTGIHSQTKGNFEPTEKMYVSFLGDLVRNIRSKTLDPVVDSNNIAKSKKVMNQMASSKLLGILEQERKLVEEKKTNAAKTIQVKIVSIVPVNKEHSYQIRWVEILYNEVGETIEQRNMTGIFITEIIPPEKSKAGLDDIMLNPVGLYVTDFSWDRDAGR